MNDRPLDTSPEAHELYRFMLTQLSGEERLLRASRMFDSAREMILASFPKDLSVAEVRRRLYQRIYNEPLPPDFPHSPA